MMGVAVVSMVTTRVYLTIQSRRLQAVDMSDGDSGFGEILEPPLSLWRLVEELVPPSERAEIRRILGEAAVDLSLDLHAEVRVLLEIWREVQTSGLISTNRCPLLADPPLIKEMVTQEIRMLLLSVRSRARHQGLDEEAALSKYNPKVVTYVMGPARPDSRGGRPPSAGGPGPERPVSALSTGSSIEEDLQELRDRLRISDIDQVIRHLRSLLEAECQSLKRDIATLQQFLEEGSEEPPEPSLTELKKERRVIERDLQSDPQPAKPEPTESVHPTRITPPTRITTPTRITPPTRITTPTSITPPTRITTPTRIAQPTRNTTTTRFPEGIRRDSMGSPHHPDPPIRATSSSSRPHDLTLDPHPPLVKTTAAIMTTSALWSPEEHLSMGQERLCGSGRGSVRLTDTPYSPAPPPKQRPPSSVPAFRRVRAPVPNLPP